MAAFEGQRSPYTFQGITVLYKGQVAAIAGTALTGSGYVAFMEMRDIDIPKATIWKAAKHITSLIVQNKNVVYAGLGDKHPNSRKFLEKLGFEYFGDDVTGGKIFVWQPSQL